MSRLRAFSAELRRRQVYRAAALYAGSAFVLVQVADLFFPRLGLPDWSVTLVVILAVLGFPLVLVLAWAFDLSPDGVRREGLGAGDSLRLAASPRRLAVAALVAVGVASVGGLWLSAAIQPLAAAERLAVLPLMNLMNDPEQEYFVQGLHDTLISELQQAGVPVIARTSVMMYRRMEKPIREIARELQVNALMEGSVLRMGDSVRVQVRLVDARTEEQLWTRSYDAALQDAISLFRRVTHEVADEMHLVLGQQERARLASARPLDPEAYDAYLRGMYLVNQFTPEGAENGLRYLRLAIEEDPADPRPYAGLAQYYTIIGHGPAPPPDAFERARAAARTALELDPALPEAHAVLAEIRLYMDWDVAGAGDAFRRALELNPGLVATRANHAWYLQLTGELDAAVAEIRRAQQLDPLAPLYPARQGWLQWWGGGSIEEAIREVRKSLELSPDFPVAWHVLACLLAEAGRYEEAIAAGERAGAASPDWMWGLGFAYARAGRRDDAHRVIARIRELPTADNNAWGLAEVHTALGEHDEAIRWLETAFDQRFSWMPWLATAPTLRPLHDDSRFQELVRRVRAVASAGPSALRGPAGGASLPADSRPHPLRTAPAG